MAWLPFMQFDDGTKILRSRDNWRPDYAEIFVIFGRGVSKDEQKVRISSAMKAIEAEVSRQS